MRSRLQSPSGSPCLEIPRIADDLARAAPRPEIPQQTLLDDLISVYRKLDSRYLIDREEPRNE